ncbi:hypothetical protein MY10362_005101 [Beauveria mimosiformis]
MSVTAVSSEQRVEAEKRASVNLEETEAPLVETKDEDYPRGLQLAFVVLGILLCLFLAALDMTIVATAIPKITDEFHAIDQVGCFYINLPIGGLSLALILFSFKPPSTAKPVPASLSEILLQLDLLGVALAVVSMVCFFLVTQWAGASRAWDSASIWQGERASLVPRILSKRVIYGVACFAFFQNGMNFFFTYYIPIYFQSIDNYSAAQSGIYNLPLIFGACFFAIISGFLITIYGYYTVYMALGSAACTIAAGLLYTMGMHTPLARPLGYQMLLGAGQGLAIQVPVIVAQAMSAPEDISASTAIILFFQMTGGAVCISAGQSAFINRLLYYLKSIAPGIDAARIVTIGASDLRSQVSSSDIDFVLQAYLGALKDTFALGVGFAGCAFLASWIAPIRNLANGSKVNVMAAL